MLKRILYTLSALLLLTRCEIGEYLDYFPESGDLQYFIECYCRPDSTFEMTATRVFPLSDLQIKDYAVGWNASIIAGKTIHLEHGIKRRPDTYFLYNYSSTERLHSQPGDTLLLDIKTPEQKHFSASTVVPKPIHLDSVAYRNDRLYIYFTPDAEVENNYYVIAVNWLTDEWHPALFFLKGHTTTQQVCHIANIKQKDLQEIQVSLKRMTAEGYNYQYTCNEERRASEDSFIAPVKLEGNIQGALGIFTCYTEDYEILRF